MTMENNFDRIGEADLNDCEYCNDQGFIDSDPCEFCNRI